jgi:murein DD-endopeptidase MepM/ murein hydrolase activator NlpD
LRRFPILLAALALALLVPTRSTPTAQAAVAAPPAPIEVVTSPAAALRPAVRLGPTAPVNFPMAPLPRCYILDNFGDPRSGGRSHQGSDMLASLGQPVYALAAGVLTKQVKVSDASTGARLSGNLWDLTRADGTRYVYGHLSAFAPGLSEGSTVTAGQVIGYVGDTGNAGPGNYHLHFEIHPKGGAAVNPLPLLTIPVGCTVY